GGSVKKSREQLSQGAQDQLLEIINDFKNNVFTISEVEKLVDSWKNRNDVQQSFKDKQEQLSQMRQEYERLQTQMKEQMKRPTPFDRIRGFFKGKPKDVKETAGDSSSGSPADGSKVVASADNVPLCMRPVSSLSLHSTCSSSSSGRMSTVSGCSGISLGDSGTHSDPEDRKQMITLPYDGGKLGKGIANYEIPPAPRPIVTQQARRFSPPRYTPAPVKLTAATVPCTCIEERPPQPVPRPDLPETEFDDGNCYISVEGICGPSQEGEEIEALDPVECKSKTYFVEG
ncbi:unnamed protein product, partial [Timema podura]|nr:unnamed protein product [Timema podura]